MLTPREDALKTIYHTTLSGIADYFQQWRALPETNPILVYSMRKVGSTSVTSTLREAGYSVYKHHCIDPDWNAELQGALTRTGFGPQHWLTDGARFQRRLARWRAGPQNARQDKRLKIFTFVKDPLAIALSDYFMQLFEFMPQAIAAKRLDKLDNLKHYFQEVIQAAVEGRGSDPLTDFLARLSNMPSDWFDREFKTTTGIDVLAGDFPVEKGYRIYHVGDCDAVLIRTDKLSEVALDAIELLIGDRPLALKEKNIRAATAEGDLYRSLLTTLRLPESLVRQFYRQPWLNHFYNEAEIETMIQRWSSAS
jgi:hypothetical protein